MRQLKSYFRTFRKRSGLSQQEVAFLLDLKSGQMVSRYERLSRTPSSAVLLAAVILFDVSPHDLLPGICKKVEKRIAIRAKTLIALFDTQPQTPRLLHKREFLLDVIERIEARHTRP